MKMIKVNVNTWNQYQQLVDEIKRTLTTEKVIILEYIHMDIPLRWRILATFQVVRLMRNGSTKFIVVGNDKGLAYVNSRVFHVNVDFCNSVDEAIRLAAEMGNH